MCKVSVIIPTYNVEAFIEACLDSIVNQSLDVYEIICVDDCSNDMTVHKIKEYKRIYNNIVLYEQPKKGPGAARNLGIHKAKGEYICFMDADDYYPNNEVLKHLYMTAKTYNVSMCGGNILNRYDDRVEQDSTNFTEEGYVKSIVAPRHLGQTRFLYKRSFILENNISYPSYIRFEDPPFVLESILKAGTYYTITDCVYVRRTGYKGIVSNLEIARGITKGILKCIELARDFRLVDYFQRELKYTLCDVIEYIGPYISDEMITHDLEEIECISISLCGATTVPFYNTESFEIYLNSINYVIAQCKKQKNILIYGAGKTAEKLMNSGYVDRNEVIGIAVTNARDVNEFMGYQVKSIDDFFDNNDSISVIVAMDEKYLPDIDKKLKSIGIEVYLAVTARCIYIAQNVLHIR